MGRDWGRLLVLGAAEQEQVRLEADWLKARQQLNRHKEAKKAKADLQRVWFEMHREMTASGQVAKYKAKVVQPGGEAVDSTVIRIGPFTATVHVTDRSYVGKDNTPAAWRLVGSGQGTMNGGSVFAPSLNRIVLDAPFYLPAGDYGLAVHHTVVNDNAYIAYVQASAGPFDVAEPRGPSAQPAQTSLFD